MAVLKIAGYEGERGHEDAEAAPGSTCILQKTFSPATFARTVRTVLDKAKKTKVRRRAA